ncbi:hypothetical protein MNBD_NITROSPINAE03-1934 [hydrothermal vent metagenome]|uniref:Uncharacterized protein n=1 Tax=hydrothermal vent metagenome TaxID=652676 RepID=A0A3B1C9D4_9ZZZZ
METRVKPSDPKTICKHCGGIMRYYRGSTTCLLCGRDGSHTCQRCQYADEDLQKTA